MSGCRWEQGPTFSGGIVFSGIGMGAPFSQSGFHQFTSFQTQPDLLVAGPFRSEETDLHFGGRKHGQGPVSLNVS